MYSGKLVFTQLMDFLPRHDFNKCVTRYRGDYRVRDFSSRDQFLVMAFAQLTYRESLRDIETCLRSVKPKLYHLGFRGRIARSTLADAQTVVLEESQPTVAAAHGVLNGINDSLACEAGATKWTTKKGTERGGRLLTKRNWQYINGQILTNVT